MPADIHDQFLAIVIADVTGRTACLGSTMNSELPLVKTKMSVADANAIHAILLTYPGRHTTREQLKIKSAKSPAGK